MSTSRIASFLAIASLVSIVSGSPVHLPADFENVAESWASGRGLPNPLVAMDGTAIDGPEDWNRMRRKELITLFQHYMYGYMPEAPEVEFAVLKSDEEVFGGLATYQEVEISFPELNKKMDAGEKEPRITLSVFTPKKGLRPYPVFLTINRCGNHTVSEYPGITIFPDTHSGGHCRNDESGRGTHTRFWSVELILRSGFAFATFHESDIDSDREDSTDGIQAHYEDYFSQRGVADGMTWGTIAAWAWGVSRAVDALMSLPDIDESRIAAVGHSRRGKSVLVAAAFDERIGLVIPHQAGTGAEALSRGVIQEPVFIMNNAFPHWFSDRYKTFNFKVGKLPVDQHELLALVAPPGCPSTDGAWVTSWIPNTGACLSTTPPPISRE